MTTSAMPVGSDSITATYGGSSYDLTSVSSALTQTVNADATTTTLSSATNRSLHDNSVTFSVAVALSGIGTGTPGGSVHQTIPPRGYPIGENALNFHAFVQVAANHDSVEVNPN